MDNNDVVVPVDKDGQASFLLPPELVKYLQLAVKEVESNILNMTFDVEMPRKDIATVINWQGQLTTMRELLAIHDSKVNTQSEE